MDPVIEQLTKRILKIKEDLLTLQQMQEQIYEEKNWASEQEAQKTKEVHGLIKNHLEKELESLESLLSNKPL